MAQVLKREVRERIVAAGRDVFFEAGYQNASMAAIGRRAGVATSNIYRYFDDKASLFEAVIPAELLDEHDRLIDERIDALTPETSATGPEERLLDFWLRHQRTTAILLDHAGPSPRSEYQGEFVDRLVRRAEIAVGRPIDETTRQILRLVFDNTRRAIAEILRSTDEPDLVRALLRGFWSYHLPGLNGLVNEAAASSR